MTSVNRLFSRVCAGGVTSPHLHFMLNKQTQFLMQTTTTRTITSLPHTPPVSKLLSYSSSFISQQLTSVGSLRWFAVVPPHISMPAPPPREYNADGSPKRYRLNQKIYEHNYTFENWWVKQVGVFHTIYHVDFAQAVTPFRAWMRTFNLTTMVIIKLSYCLLISLVYLFGPLVGLKPKYFTIEWQEAMKERDRAENSNSIQCYLDRRRKERGSHWLGKEHLFGSPMEYSTYDLHDVDAQQARAQTLAAREEKEGKSVE
eukprot:GHVS01022767.1.p1 GENE.GHVS01022767.1~~GHVS01022767.1.p1  ORF type:complete len:291 (+),score=32.25 GHVS01022767.1:100-873(+)